MTASKLLEAQWMFASMVPLLIQKAIYLGYKVSLGDAYRDSRCPYGSKSSKHKIRLAIDLNLFNQDGQYITDHEGHDKLGLYWQSLGGIWGGDFEDPNHYEWPYPK